MRYTAPINLKLNGEDVGEDHALVGIARTFLGTMMEINSSDPIGQKWTRRLTDGSIITGYIPAVGMLPVVTVTSPPPPKDKELVSEVCHSGLMVIPVSDENNSGWGLPFEGDTFISPIGTPGGNNNSILFKNIAKLTGETSKSFREYFQSFPIKRGIEDEESEVSWMYYINESTGDVYTWGGQSAMVNTPAHRYNFTPSGSAVFLCGELYTLAPFGDVLGVCVYGGFLYLVSSDTKVYKRPSLTSYQNHDVYHKDDNPNGWQEVLTLPAATPVNTPPSEGTNGGDEFIRSHSRGFNDRWVIDTTSPTLPLRTTSIATASKSTGKMALVNSANLFVKNAILSTTCPVGHWDIDLVAETATYTSTCSFAPLTISTSITSSTVDIMTVQKDGAGNNTSRTKEFRFTESRSVSTPPYSEAVFGIDFVGDVRTEVKVRVAFPTAPSYNTSTSADTVQVANGPTSITANSSTSYTQGYQEEYLDIGTSDSTLISRYGISTLGSNYPTHQGGDISDKSTFSTDGTTETKSVTYSIGEFTQRWRRFPTIDVHEDALLLTDYTTTSSSGGGTFSDGGAFTVGFQESYNVSVAKPSQDNVTSWTSPPSTRAPINVYAPTYPGLDSDPPHLWMPHDLSGGNSTVETVQYTDWISMHSFTQEAYGHILSDLRGNIFISAKGLDITDFEKYTNYYYGMDNLEEKVGLYGTNQRFIQPRLI